MPPPQVSRRLNVQWRPTMTTRQIPTIPLPPGPWVDPPKATVRRLPTPGMGREDGAELHQPAGVIGNEPLSIQPVEVLGPEVAVGLAGPKHVPRDDQDGAGGALHASEEPLRAAFRAG